jgi:hypothetical protein
VILFALLPFLAAVDEDAFTVTLGFERMHCDECKAELDAGLRKLPGVRLVSYLAGSAVLVFDEKQPVPLFNRFPKDLNLRTVTLSLRGTVGVSGDKVTLVARSGATFALVNPEKSRDHVGDLRKKLGAKARFHVTGLLAADGKTISIQSFQATDWKD